MHELYILSRAYRKAAAYLTGAGAGVIVSAGADAAVASDAAAAGAGAGAGATTGGGATGTDAADAGSQNTDSEAAKKRYAARISSSLTA